MDSVLLVNILVSCLGAVLGFLLYKIFGTLTELNTDLKLCNTKLSDYSNRLTAIETKCALYNCNQRPPV
jgi:glycopeptide antibiotics resistance protein